jgi:site-specific DNA-adenine methylase
MFPGQTPQHVDQHADTSEAMDVDQSPTADGGGQPDLTPIAVSADSRRGTPYQELLAGHYPFTGAKVKPEALDCFAGIVGSAYWRFIRDNTTWVNDFTNYWLPSNERLAWLVPYTGNAHNRAMFTQLVLYVVAKLTHIENKTHLPNLYEPFIGSGQIFMGADDFADQLLEPPPFGRLVAGDLNPFLISTYRAMQAYADFPKRYEVFARELDDELQERVSLENAVLEKRVYERVRDEVNHQINRSGAATDLAVGMRYIWLVNRCRRGTTVSNGVLHANLNPSVNLFRVSQHERTALPLVHKRVMAAPRSFRCADFAQTTATAKSSDVVMMDCPFPKFSIAIPKQKGKLRSKPSNVYGLDNDKSLQLRIIEEARRLVRQGTTVVLCNFANPDLVLAYATLLRRVGVENPRDFIYTYRSPRNESSVYQLVVIPGTGTTLTGAPEKIRRLARMATGDDRFI